MTTLERFQNDQRHERELAVERRATILRSRSLVSICGWCPDAQEQTIAARANGYDVTHTMCPACQIKFEENER